MKKSQIIFLSQRSFAYELSILALPKDLQTLIIEKKIVREFLKSYGISLERKRILVTGHKRESFGMDFEEL